AGGLASVQPRQVVALEARPRAAFVVALHAIGWRGAVAAPLNARATAAERAVAAAALKADFTLSIDGLAHGDALAERDWALDETRLRVLTSGTTGTPRAVDLSTAQLAFGAFGSAMRLGHAIDDRWLHCLPLHHVGGLAIWFRAAFGATTVELLPGFSAETVAARLDSGAISLVSLTPTMLAAVLDARPDKPFPSALRAILLGGAAASTALLDRCRALAAPVAVTWGMTEAGSQVCTRFAGDLAPDAGVGSPLAFARVNAEADGALRVSGPLVGGTLVTRDRGAVDATGNVHVAGRIDDVIVSGGVNLDPAEIEQVLALHSEVADVAVVAVDDARFGQRPVAVLVARGADRPDDAALRAFCRAQLTPYKTPDAFFWRAELPRDGLGKRSRAAVRAALTDSENGAPTGAREETNR
ncbi:MAG: AMP-binding protein, partial [Myxococcales bacterium]|nr:AMP-binding protein [Myxococcales bacterium]